MNMEKVILEPSSNTHVLHARQVKQKSLGDGIVALQIEGEGIVTHGEHGTLKTEARNVINSVTVTQIGRAHV